MFQPLSSYTATPQMQQQQNLADALRGDGGTSVGPVSQQQALNATLSNMPQLSSQIPGMARMVMPGLQRMLADQMMRNPPAATPGMDNPAMQAIAANNLRNTNYSPTPGQGGG